MSSTEKEYKEHIKHLEQQILLLKEQVDFLTRKLYGTKSEKTSALQIEGQMSLFNQKEGLIPRSLLRNKLFQDMEEVIY